MCEYFAIDFEWLHQYLVIASERLFCHLFFRLFVLRLTLLLAIKHILKQTMQEYCAVKCFVFCLLFYGRAFVVFVCVRYSIM